MLGISRVVCTSTHQGSSLLRSSLLLSQRRLFSVPVTKVPPRVLITGCLGQIGTELVFSLRNKYGAQNVIASDCTKPKDPSLAQTIAPFRYADVLQSDHLEKIIVEDGIDWVIHNAALLSGTSEKNPQYAMQLNTQGVHNVLELARKHNLRVFIPSSIAAFGPTTPLDNTPDVTIQRPTTIYGIGKVYAEHVGEYYHLKWGVDFRSLRYPGIISSKTLPGGGTTDYAVEMYYYALEGRPYECFLEPDEVLPMMYMPDCINATLAILEADSSKLTQRTYNVNAMSFAPKDQVKIIQKYVPNFQVTYKPDFRQNIAKTWPGKLEDSKARNDWGWKEQFDLDAMSRDMLSELRKKFAAQKKQN